MTKTPSVTDYEKEEQTHFYILMGQLVSHDNDEVYMFTQTCKNTYTSARARLS